MGGQKLILPLDDLCRFWQSLRKTETCWIWEATIRKREGKDKKIKYGNFQVSGTNYLAHRISFFLHHYMTEENVLHSCDNSLCVNPLHLMEGTQAENNRQMAERGRHIPATRILTETQVITALNLKGQISAKALALELKVSTSTIEALWAGRSWKHLQ